MVELLSSEKIVDYLVPVDAYAFTRRWITTSVLMSVGKLLGLC